MAKKSYFYIINKGSLEYFRNGKWNGYSDEVDLFSSYEKAELALSLSGLDVSKAEIVLCID